MTGQENTAGPAADAFEAHVAERLRDSADEIDGATRSRLNRSRQAALEQLGQRAAWQSRPALAAVAATAMAAVAVLLWNPVSQQAETPVTANVDVPDLELLMADESLEMLEDLEFYAWLADNDLDGGTAG